MCFPIMCVLELESSWSSVRDEYETSDISKLWSKLLLLLLLLRTWESVLLSSVLCSKGASAVSVTVNSSSHSVRKSEFRFETSFFWFHNDYKYLKEGF